MMSILSTKVGKMLVSKLITKTLRKKLPCKTAKATVGELQVVQEAGKVKIYVELSAIMSEEELMTLIEEL